MGTITIHGRGGRLRGAGQRFGSLWLTVRLLFVAVLATILASSVAAACSCAFSTTPEHVDRADVVARVIIERIEPPPPSEITSSADLATYILRPTRVWKGDIDGIFTVESAVSGASCGLEFIADGDDVILFATDFGDGLAADLCGGTAKTSDELRAEVEDVLGEGRALSVLPPAETERPRSSESPADPDETGEGGGSNAAWLAVVGGAAAGLLVAAILVVRGRRWK